MKARVQLVEGMTFVAESGSGHAVVVDAAPDVGGRNLGARPMELVLMGTGTCSAIDVVHILRKARQAITGRDGQGPRRRPGRARDQAVEGKVLLCHGDAGEERRDRVGLRDSRRLRR